MSTAGVQHTELRTEEAIELNSEPTFKPESLKNVKKYFVKTCEIEFDGPHTKFQSVLIYLRKILIFLLRA